MKKKPPEKEYVVSERLKTYLEKYDKNAPANIKKAREEKAAARKAWWSKNWIAFASMVLSVIAVIIAILK